MKYVDWTLPCVISAMWLGCAGEIENPDDFRKAAEAVSVADAGDLPAAGSSGKSGNGGSTAGSWGPEPLAGSAGSTDPEDDAGVAMPPAAGGGGSGGGGGDAGTSGASGSAAGSGGTGGNAMADAGPSCDFRGLLMMKCGNSSCHGGPTASTGLDLTSPSLAMRVQGKNAGGACSDTLLVDPENPEESALYKRVVGSDCGVRMPLGGSMTPAEQACVLSWIEGL